MKIKRCSKCKKRKSLKKDFYRSAKSVDGRGAYCKECKASYDRPNMHRKRRMFSYRFHSAKFAAKTRNLSWEITQDQYRELVNLRCHYCDTSEMPECGSGLDRKNSAVGYTTENVVSCCYRCNAMKADFFTHDEMVLLGRVVKRIRKTRAAGNLSCAIAGTASLVLCENQY